MRIFITFTQPLILIAKKVRTCEQKLNLSIPAFQVLINAYFSTFTQPLFGIAKKGSRNPFLTKSKSKYRYRPQSSTCTSNLNLQ